MKRLTALAIGMLLLSAMDAYAVKRSWTPTALLVAADVVEVCASLERIDRNLVVSNDQIFEAGLCKGFWSAGLDFAISKGCEGFSVIPGYNLQYVLDTMHSLERANREAFTFSITARYLVELTVDEMLGPKENRKSTCTGEPLGGWPKQ